MRRGLRVVVLERAESTAGATRVAAGMLAPVGELQHGEEVLLEMTLAAAGMYSEWAGEVEEASGAADGLRAAGEPACGAGPR